MRKKYFLAKIAGDEEAYSDDVYDSVVGLERAEMLAKLHCMSTGGRIVILESIAVFHPPTGEPTKELIK